MVSVHRVLGALLYSVVLVCAAPAPSNPQDGAAAFGNAVVAQDTNTAVAQLKAINASGEHQD